MCRLLHHKSSDLAENINSEEEIKEQKKMIHAHTLKGKNQYYVSKHAVFNHLSLFLLVVACLTINI